jgi:hypothetical protein
MSWILSLFGLLYAVLRAGTDPAEAAWDAYFGCHGFEEREQLQGQEGVGEKIDLRYVLMSRRR